MLSQCTILRELDRRLILYHNSLIIMQYNATAYTASTSGNTIHIIVSTDTSGLIKSTFNESVIVQD